MEESVVKNRYPFRNLIFEGGGMKGLAYLGAFEVLGQYKIDQQIERVAGACTTFIDAFNKLNEPGDVPSENQ